MTEQEFIAFCEEQGLDAESALDDMVHELASLEASAINNSGIEGQLEYLQMVNKLKDEDLKASLQP